MAFLQLPEPCEPSCSLCAKLVRKNLDESFVVLSNELTGESKVVPQYAVGVYVNKWSPFYERDSPRFSPFLTPPSRPISVSSPPDSGLNSLDHSTCSTSPDSRAFPIQRLMEKARFCSIVESTECLRCQKSALDIDSFNHRSSSVLSSDGYVSGYCGSGADSGRSCTSLISSLSNMSIDDISNNNNSSNFGNKNRRKDNDVPNISDSMKTCSFCYGQHKKHCQKLNRPWPRIQDIGPWHGHVIKDSDGRVECPELFKVMCSLCFATGYEAHTIKFCPLNAV